MTKQPVGLLLDMISLDRNSPTPLYRQLDAQLRAAVLSGRLAAGVRLPSTRQLAMELGLSRLTVQNTYEQLVAEGFLTSTTGSGTFVTDFAPEDMPPKRPVLAGPTVSAEVALSQRGRAISRLAIEGSKRP